MDPAKVKAAMREGTTFPDADGDEGAGAEQRPGAMLRAALAAKDDDAIEEAIKACVGGSY